MLPRAQLPEFCFTAEIFSINNHKSHAADASQVLYAGLSFGGKLHVTMEGGVSRTIANNVTSFTIASNFLIFTTSAHVSHYAPLRTLAEYFDMPSSDVPEAPLPEWETRRVERGSRIVTVVPSAMNLVLQMPRGNLETINPRPLVMEIVRQDVDKYVNVYIYRADTHAITQGGLQQSVPCMPETPDRSQCACGAQSDCLQESARSFRQPSK